MAQSTRLHGAHISGVTIAGTNFAGVCESGELSWTLDTQEGVALKDLNHYPLGIRAGWQYTGTFFCEGTGTTGQSLWDTALDGVQVAFVLVDNAVGGTTGTHTGAGIITQCRQSTPDGAQTVNITLTGQGALTPVIA